MIILSCQNIFKTPARLIFLRPVLILFDYDTNSPELYDRGAIHSSAYYTLFLHEKTEPAGKDIGGYLLFS